MRLLLDTHVALRAIITDSKRLLLIAQAIHEPLRLLTADALREPYSELVVRV